MASTEKSARNVGKMHRVQKNSSKNMGIRKTNKVRRTQPRR